ncbi:MAG: NAD(P)H-hydrate dehydratase [Phycisphaeraceae bacterium]
MPDLESVTALPSLPARPADGHKGTFGTVIVVAGSEAMIGAPALVATAALRTGTGLVRLAVPRAILPFCITIEPSATGLPLGDDPAANHDIINTADPRQRAVVAAGPGLAENDASEGLIHALLADARPLVLDASGLNLLARSHPKSAIPNPKSDIRTILTPHPGEFARLAEPLGITHSATDADERPAAAAALARALHAVVVLKGRHSVITDGQRVCTNHTGSAALATAGTGDVLTGIIASLLGQGMNPFDAAVLGAHLHGLAAEQWTAAHGQAGLRAADLAHAIPTAAETLPRA